MPPFSNNLKALKEVATFLGQKLDEIREAVRNTPQKIDLNLGESTKQLESAAKELTALAETVKKNEQSRNFNDIRSDFRQLANDISNASASISKAVGTLSDKEQKETNRKLDNLERTVKNIKVEQKDVDMSGIIRVEKEVTNLRKVMEKLDNKETNDLLKQLVKALNKFSVDIPDTVKIDEQQFRELRQTGGGARVSTQTEDVPVGYEQVTVNDSATGLSSIPQRANKAVVVVTDADIRWRNDGTNPTSSVGMFWGRRATFTLIGRPSLSDFKAIRTGSTNAKLDVSYYEIL